MASASAPIHEAGFLQIGDQFPDLRRHELLYWNAVPDMLSRVALDGDARFSRKARISLVEKTTAAPTQFRPWREVAGVFFHWAQPSTPIEQVPCQSVTTHGTR